MKPESEVEIQLLNTQPEQQTSNSEKASACVRITELELIRNEKCEKDKSLDEQSW